MKNPFILNYKPCDVFICMECTRMQARRAGLSYEPGQSVPHCNCTGEPIKMGFIHTVARHTYEQRKAQAKKNWMAFRLGEQQGRYARRLSPEGIREAYEAGVA